MNNRTIVIGSRGSDLALWQANFVLEQLQQLNCRAKIKVIKTQGDRIQHLSFDKMEGKGFFTKELEEKLLSKEIDLAVHSHKDLETTSPNGLCIAAVSARANMRDILLIRKEAFDKSAPLKIAKNSIVGTSSARRKAQINFLDNSLQLKDLRGNVPTRIQKLRDGFYDAIMLAAAGVERLKLDLSEFELFLPAPEVFVPAPAQGVLAYQTRSDDAELMQILEAVNNPLVQQEIKVERTVLQAYGSGCQLPFGAYCKKEKDAFQLYISAENEQGKLQNFFLEEKTTNTLLEKGLKVLPKKKRFSSVGH